MAGERPRKDYDDLSANVVVGIDGRKMQAAAGNKDSNRIWHLGTVEARIVARIVGHWYDWRHSHGCGC